MPPAPTPEFLCRAVEVAIAAGATTINLPDTVGYGTPETIGADVHTPWASVPNADKAVFQLPWPERFGPWRPPTHWPRSKAGARQIECTINGIGERAGNTSLEEVVMALKTPRSVRFECGVKPRIPLIMRASRSWSRRSPASRCR
jgi:2-isopropylmalate synthase